MKIIVIALTLLLFVLFVYGCYSVIVKGKWPFEKDKK